ncbi:carboxylesterase family domain-containing protein [Phthorimaea operculella]|nr:carboxylesterase family domain-containing protein [Phthorimaea operculella]
MDSIPEESKYIITINDGPICGYVETKSEKTYYKFKGIPFAQPPLKDLRFKPPLPVKPWDTLIDCTQEAPQPIGYNIKFEIDGSEDCLYLDVISPNIKPDKPLPVMFWIGNYGYTYHVDEIIDPSFIVDEEVIFVRCGFRLGPLGFLSINDLIAPGNCGMKDIVLALQWVKNNISNFGGDPKNVTIFGSSAGGTAVHLLMLSPMASGLFHKAIMQSACALGNWVLTKTPVKVVQELAKKLGIIKSSPRDIVEELKNIPARKLLEAYGHHLNPFDKDGTFLPPAFCPCIEEDFEGTQAFLTKSPPLILKSGNYNKVPCIIGSNNNETSSLQYINENFYKDFENFNKHPELIVPRSLSTDLEISKRIGQQVLKFYLDGEETLRKDTISQYIQFVSDYHYLYYIYKAVKLHNQYAPEYPIYYYILNQAGEWYVPKDCVLNVFNSEGHCAELPFLFGLKCNENHTWKGSKDSVKTRRRFIKLWTNFSKYGDPTPDEDDPLLQIKWDAVENKNKLNYLCIGSELTKGKNPFSERMEFWEGLHKEYTCLRTLVYISELGVTSW